MSPRQPLKPLVLLLSLLFAASLFAQVDDFIEVDDVRFDSVDQDWIMTTVTLNPGENILPDAPNPDYIDDVTVKVYLAWQNDNDQFDIYTAQATIITLEKNERVNVHFFLPGIIVVRDSLDTEPFFYLVEVEVGGRLLSLGERNVSRQFAGNQQAIASLKSNAGQQEDEHEGILRPIYLAPGGLARVDRVPTYIRKESD